MLFKVIMLTFMAWKMLLQRGRIALAKRFKEDKLQVQADPQEVIHSLAQLLS